MIKKISGYLLMVGMALTLTISCDKIDEPFSTKIEIDTSNNNTAKKRVLLEDYTGHTCVNCPGAAVIAHDLKTIYKDRLIIIAVHAGWFSNPTASGEFTNDFRTPEGTEWDTYFGISAVGNPNGMVDRKGLSETKHILSPSAWAEAVGTALNDPLQLNITIENDYNSSNRSLNTEVSIDFLATIDKNLKLIVAITEDGIIAPQKNNNEEIGTVPVISDYEHNHMLRAVINSTWGTQVATAGTSNPETLKKSFTYTLDEKLNAGNCSVVAFVYDNDTKEVLQVAQEEL